MKSKLINHYTTKNYLEHVHQLPLTIDLFLGMTTYLLCRKLKY